MKLFLEAIYVWIVILFLQNNANFPFRLAVCFDGYWGDECQNKCTCGSNNKGEAIPCNKNSSKCRNKLNHY